LRRSSFDQVILAIMAWLEPGDEDRILANLRGWNEAHWELARNLAFMHGVSPSLHHRLSSAPRLYDAFPSAFKAYLESQAARNASRIQRVQEELSAILTAAERKGIQVMPLKGSLFFSLGQVDPKLRPMADIDLLVRPADRLAMGDLLAQRGYAIDKPKMLFIHHDHYDHPDQRVVSMEGEHPDNPLPVEIHTDMRRVLWGDVIAPDFTPILWESAAPGEVLGQRVWIPGYEAHFAYLCLHTLVHFMVYKGRLTYWLDLARLAPGIPDFSRLPQAALLYPQVRLAARGLPQAFAGIDLLPMAALAQPRVRHWTESIPLNYRCGLLNQHTPQRPSPIGERWEYWHPTQVRLMLAYPEITVPGAFLVHIGQSILHLLKRALGLLRKTKHRK
jgi:hypothetical protein